MQKPLLLGVLTISLTMPLAAIAEDKTIEDRVKALEQRYQKFEEHERRESVTERKEMAAPPGGQPSAPGTGPITEIAKERPGEGALSFGSTGSGRLVYAKPFLSAPKSTIGGYADIQFNALTAPNFDNRSRNTFNQIRMVPFIYADITDRIKFATEIEIERGGPSAQVSGDGSLQIEFSQIDYLVNEAINLRAGVLLVPVGKFNLLHDSPLNDLVDRPMVSRLVIPSTWSEAGAGLYGTVYPSRMAKLDYELYVINGLSATPGSATATSRITDDAGLRNARGSLSRDRDDGKSIVGRFAYSPMLGIEVAGSFYHGLYSNKNAATGINNASNYADIFAIDWTLQKGPWELIGESAWSRISGNETAGYRGPAGMQGYYIQANYHFMPEWLKKAAPTHFTDASTFTAVVRWERVDTDTDDRTLGNTPTAADPGFHRGELERLTLGLNFRPIEDTVFKFDYQFNTQKNTTISNVTNVSTNRTGRIDGNGFMFMAATYF